MARLSRLLSAVSLGIAVTAAVGAATMAVEHNRVRSAPANLQESATEGRVIVKFKAHSSILSATNSSTSSGRGPQKAAVLGGRLGLALTDGRILGERTQVLKSSGMTSTTLAAAVASDIDVEWVQVDHRRFVQALVSDPYYPDGVSTSVAANGPAAGQWYLRAPNASVEDSTGLLNVSGINIEPAWAITHGSGSVIIADIDTGITNHPDITGSAPGASDSKLFAATFSGTTASTPYGYDFVGLNAGSSTKYTKAEGLLTANDGSLADPDPSDPGDWITAAEDAGTVDNNYFKGCGATGGGAEDSSWHGTQTGGILAATTNNGVGIAGTAYDTKLVPVRALGKCGGYDSEIVAAAEWAAGLLSDPSIPVNSHVARVINMSLGGPGTCAIDAPVYIDALTKLRDAGVVVVAAAGNEEGLATDIPANCQPASTDSDQTPIVIAVAGLRNAGTKVGYSDIGPQVTVAAPAGNCVNTSGPCLFPIVTTTNTGKTSPVSATYSDGLDNPSLGTSFATPLVSGTVALMLAAAPNLTNKQVIGLLKSTARAFPTTGGSSGISVCHAPTTAVQDECYCTTSTCGAGMLDAGAAVAAAAALSTGTSPVAVISPGSATVTVGSTVTLSGAGSTLGSSGTALTYAWSIPDNDTHITLDSTSGSSVVITGTSAGTGQVKLTVTDPSNALSNSQTIAVTVTAASSGGGGGGGAANPAWLAALALAGLLLRPRRRARPRE